MNKPLLDTLLDTLRDMSNVQWQGRTLARESLAEIERLRAELEETEGDKQSLLKTLECVTCKGSLTAPLQCAHCIETERVPEGMPQRPATTVFRLRAETAEKERDEALGEIVGLKAALACCPASTPPCELDTRWQDLVRLWTQERYARCAAERKAGAA